MMTLLSSNSKNRNANNRNIIRSISTGPRPGKLEVNCSAL